jgi:hypothetical protein
MLNVNYKTLLYKMKQLGIESGPANMPSSDHVASEQEPFASAV